MLITWAPRSPGFIPRPSLGPALNVLNEEKECSAADLDSVPCGFARAGFVSEAEAAPAELHKGPLASQMPLVSLCLQFLLGAWVVKRAMTRGEGPNEEPLSQSPQSVLDLRPTLTTDAAQGPKACQSCQEVSQLA